MLTRLIFKRQPTFIVRLLSDKVGDGEAKPITETTEPDSQSTKIQKVSASTEKIQDLLKSMIETNKMKEKSRVLISTAPGTFKRNKNKVTELKEEKIEEKVMTAVSEVAMALGGNTKRTEAELLSRVLGDVTQSPTNLSDLVLGMQVDRSKEPDEGFKLESRGEEVRRLVRQVTPGARRPYRNQSALKSREPIHISKAIYIDIFSESPLGILKPIDNPKDGPRMETWEKLKQRERSLATIQPPSNYFEKMIQWTEQGKVWKFPINNEQGLEEEAKVHFTEHVFVENHLEGWCPPRGPIRHFMELVCVGLSKNPFYTAQEKKDHIMWFKDYFESKKDILAQVEGLEYASNTKNEQNV